MNIIGIKENGAVRPVVSATYEFRPGDHVMVAGENSDVARMMK